LFRRYPSFREHVPHLSICDLPTPVEPLPLAIEGVDTLYIKRDDITATPYGGNKIRKLEFLLADAKRAGAGRLVTFGYAGSNHALATALYGSHAGFRVTSILLPQSNAHYVRRNLLAGHAAGAQLIARDRVTTIGITVAALAAKAFLLRQSRPYIIPAGGSSPVGVLGYVNAAFELADQIDTATLPRPDRIYLSLGSMGTTAGLAIGFALANIPVEIHAVRVVDTRFGSREKLGELVLSTVRYLRKQDPSVAVIDPMQHVTIRDEFFGRQYGEFTASGVEAVTRARENAHIRLDGTYSGKALSALLADAQQGGLADKNVLFWNTHNSRDVDALTQGTDYHALPRAFHRYFTDPVQSLDPGA